MGLYASGAHGWVPGSGFYLGNGDVVLRDHEAEQNRASVLL